MLPSITTTLGTIVPEWLAGLKPFSCVIEVTLVVVLVVVVVLTSCIVVTEPSLDVVDISCVTDDNDVSDDSLLLITTS